PHHRDPPRHPENRESLLRLLRAALAQNFAALLRRPRRGVPDLAAVRRGAGDDRPRPSASILALGLLIELDATVQQRQPRLPALLVARRRGAVLPGLAVPAPAQEPAHGVAALPRARRRGARGAHRDAAPARAVGGDLHVFDLAHGRARAR